MNIDFAFFWRLVMRRMPVMAIFVIAGSGMGVIAALQLPDTYVTSARLLVEAPQIPDSMVSSTIQTDAVEQLDIIEQKLLTRANMIDVAQKYEVFEDMRDMEPDSIVESMQAATTIRRSAGRNQATLMRISFEGRSARIVANVVNEFETIVLQENIEARERSARSTLSFFEEEVNRLARDLDEQSSKIAVFKSANATSLPEDQSYRLGRQALLQERISRYERELSLLTGRREQLIQIFKETGQIGTDRRGVQRSPEEERLLNAQAQLDLLKSTYSEENPRVKRLQTTVDRLAAVVDRQKEDIANLDDADGGGEGRALLEATLADIDSRMAFIQEDLTSNIDEFDELQDAISKSSANGIELATLERSFEVIQSRYDTAVQNLNAARMSERIETTAQGQRISTIESANVPSVPSGPDRPKIAIAGAGIGIMLAAGYFFLLELLNRSVRRPAELVNRFNITPITTIPYMESRGRRFARRSGLVLATLGVLVAVPALLFYIDTYYLPLEVVVQRGLQRLGIS